MGTADGIFQCRPVGRRTEREAYDAKFIEALTIKYDDYVLKGARSSHAVTLTAPAVPAAVGAPVVRAQR